MNLISRNTLKSLCVLSISATLLLSSLVRADAALDAIKAALPGELINDPLGTKWDPSGDDLKIKVLRGAPVVGGMALQAKVRRKQKNIWDVNLRSKLEQDIKKGDKVQMFLWARTEKPAKGSDTGTMNVSVGRNVKPWDSVLNGTIEPTAEWKLYDITGTAKKNFPAKQLQYGFNLGAAKQTVQIGQVYLVKLDNTQASSPTNSSSNASSSSPGPSTNGAWSNFGFAYGPGVKTKQVSADIDGGRALQVVSKQQLANPWEAAVGAQKLAIPISRGDKVVFEFWARSIGESSSIRAIVQRASAPYEGIAAKSISLTSEWKKYTVEGLSAISLASGEAGVTVQIGQQPQSLEFGQFKVTVGK